MKAAFVLAVALGLVYQAQAPLPPAFPRPGFEQLADNEFLVAWKGILGVKGIPTVLHQHNQDLVGVFLDPGQVQNTALDGTVRVGAAFVRGAVAFQPRGVSHTEEVLVDGTRAVGIEPKVRPRPAAPGENLADDGRVILDNDSVLIREYAFSPGTPVRQVYPAARSVVVSLESGEIAEAQGERTGGKEAVVFGEVSLAAANVARQVVATRGTPKVIVVTVR